MQTSADKTTEVTAAFTDAFDALPNSIGSAPGRVNIIGEHTDYNGGWVLPTALKRQTNVAMSPRDDQQVLIKANRFEGLAVRSLNETAKGHWSDHALGALIAAVEARLWQGGANIQIISDVPDGAGLSSSAAVIVATLKAARGSDPSTEMSDTDLAILARRVENNFIGVPCGIMDQMAVALASPHQAMALDTASLTYEMAPLPSTHHVAVVHSGIARQLNDGRYKERKEECDAAREAFGLRDICQLDPELIDTRQDIDPVIRRRAMHCATEHHRVLASLQALRANDIGGLGHLLRQSHSSMRDDFEISTPEIDALVEDACALGAAGARLTGGGFGGCIVALVMKDHVADWSKALLGKHPQAWVVE